MDTPVTPRWTDRDILIPNELEQRQMFYIIKKASSWTGWNRALGYYRKWAEIAENSVREADNSGLLAANKSDITYQRYVNILKGLATFEEGVNRLRRGDRRVFLYSEAYGFFARSFAPVNHWLTFLFKINCGDYRWAENTPYRGEFFKAFDELCEVHGECAPYVGDVTAEGEGPANVSYDLWIPIFLPGLSYPDPLPELPKRPKKDIIVPTGELIPFSGIWEPLDTEEDQLFGVMNYLHAERKAPQYEQTFIDHTNEELGYDVDIIDVRWRLIWRDDRYEDGTIPEEEKDYIFVCPVLEGEQNPFSVETIDYIEEHGIPNPFLVGARRHRGERVEGGEPCPRDGYWWSPANKSQGRIFRKGEIMPIITSREYAESYWLWGGEAEKK
ncbi:MAG: immunity 71 family protein [Azoarcus sp.]|jgi:hypothetical protein|nr:immunity 71 family protein [Azoarcus sp.]